MCGEHLVLIPCEDHVRLSICDVSSTEIIVPRKIFAVHLLLCETDHFPSLFS